MMKRTPSFRRRLNPYRRYLVESLEERRLLTTPGDADENGIVDFADFLALSANFGVADAGWSQGDFDGSGSVDFADFLLLSRNFGSSVATVTPVTPAEIAERLPAVDFVLLDVRTQGEWEQDGHIDSATRLTWPSKLQANVENEIAKDTEIVVYCRSGNRSGQAANWLVEHGYTNVKDMGGINDWKAAGFPVSFGP